MALTFNRRTVIDSAVILSIFGVIYYAGALTEQVKHNGENIERQTRAIASMDLELQALRNQPITAEASRRIAVLESKSEASDKALDQLRSDMNARFDRLEQKLDRALN